MKRIDSNTPTSEIQALLENLDWIKNETISKQEIPGAGNMNVVLRVFTDKRTFILKQSRPFVQKYPDLAAPVDRIDVEYQFYMLTEAATADHSAEIIAYSKEHNLMMLSDLGDCEDMVSIYAERNIVDIELNKLVGIAQRIHNAPVTIQYPANTALRELNHQHIFVLPFMEDNGFGLDDVQSGLQELSLQYKRDESLKTEIQKLGNKYLSNGSELIHGDYYPGSWMRSSDQLYIIDSEFSFIGFKEFDLGVMAAHLIMTTSDVACLDKIINQYNGDLDHYVVEQIAGIEIMRRLIGLAQLPLERSLEEKATLLKTATELILN